MSDFLQVLKQFDYLAALWWTIKLSVLSIIGALLIGTVVGVMRMSPVRVFQRFGAAYVTLVRNTPLTLIAFFGFGALFLILGWKLWPSDSLQTQAFVWAVWALSVYHASFVAEALRSGVNTVPVGQAEAARAIGLTFGQSLREVILPQAARGGIAPLGNVLIALIKNTTVAATISNPELSSFLKSALEARADLKYLIFLAVAVAFVVLTLPLGVAFTRLSQKLSVQR